MDISKKSPEGDNEAATLLPDRNVHEVSRVRLIIYVISSILFTVANAITYKLMLNTYKSRDAAFPHDYEFFVNQWNVFLYVVICSCILIYKVTSKGGLHYLAAQESSPTQLTVMASLDALGGFLCSIGGAYTGGALQTLLNQTIIPVTLFMSYFYLSTKYRASQCTGAMMIVCGAVVAVIPSLTARSSSSTTIGAAIYLSSVLPGAFSNVYKEYAFRTQTHCDVYYMTTVVSALQVLLGFGLMPLLCLPGFGGIPMREIPSQLHYGFQCFLGNNSQPGDDCSYAFYSMMAYVFVNFFFNIIQLLVTKHGSASLVVVTSALALPLTNICFSFEFIMGKDVEAFSTSNLVALVVVVVGFLFYSLSDQQDDKLMPIQAAGGSAIYVRERSASDPSTPGYTPQIPLRQRFTPRPILERSGYQAIPMQTIAEQPHIDDEDRVAYSF